MRMTLIPACLLALLPATAQAADPACLTPSEFSSLAAYALPSAITGTAKRCSQTLGPNSYLGKSGASLAGRYAARRASSWPGAKAAFLKLSAGRDETANQLFRSMPDESLKQMLDPLLEGMVVQKIPVEKCGTIDTFVRLLSPLPPENTAELIAVTVGLATKAKDGKTSVGKIDVCEA
ncbi:hypothetical protein B2G71_18430 [Novosphingobium sp. PC22D]|uniref:hypothetical protein n=1 Tax=Novosphingobium sp. PC22D TaxID=1962403 RepID=UPI000BFAF9B4|nr:hypothetical protein [Novosphingobium sp. PC22D]PEQ11262.1 hypothetical protein B2G71_18430 [Novosphingobium sp. PC22D]